MGGKSGLGSRAQRSLIPWTTRSNDRHTTDPEPKGSIRSSKRLDPGRGGRSYESAREGRRLLGRQQDDVGAAAQDLGLDAQRLPRAEAGQGRELHLRFDRPANLTSPRDRTVVRVRDPIVARETGKLVSIVMGTLRIAVQVFVAAVVRDFSLSGQSQREVRCMTVITVGQLAIVLADVVLNERVVQAS